MTGDQAWWEARYAAADPLYGDEPSAFLARNLALAKPGEALDVGSGEGRNAALLARHGFAVTAVDFAPTAVERARRRLAASAPAPQVLAQDLQFYLVPLMRFSLIAVIDTKPPLTVLKGLARGLASGGTLIVENFLTTQIGRPGLQPDVSECYRPQELLEHVQGLRLAYYDERAAADEPLKVRLIAQKP